MRTAFEREGAIRSVDLLAAFATLWRRRSSGVLRFSRAGETVRFDVAEGDVTRVTASDPGFDTIQVLVRAGKLDAATLEGRRFPSGKDRALAAREMGLLTDRDWRWGERIRDVEILAYLVGWLDGTYEFDAAARPEATESRIGIHRLILELFLRSRDRAFVHHALPAVDVPLQRSADFEEKFATLGLTPDALAVAAAIDGRATAAEISRKTPPDPFSVDKLLAALATLGLLHPEYAAEPAPETTTVAPEEAEEEEEEELPPPPPPPPPAAPPAPAAAETRPEPEDIDIRIEPLDLPIAAPVEPSEPEPALVAWDSSAPEPMDQRLDVAGGEIEPTSRRSVPAAVWLLLLLAIAVGALLLSRARERGEPAAQPAAATEPVLTATVPLVEPTLSAPGGTGFPAAVVPTEPASRPSAAPAPTLEPRTPAPPTEVPPTPVPTPPPTPVPTSVPPTPVPTRIPPTPVPTHVPPTAIPPTRVPPTRVPPTAVPPTRIPPTRIPTAPIPTARPVTAVAVPPAAGASAGGRTREEWLALAQRDQRRLASQPGAQYTVQLELVCELDSLAEAWRFDRRGEMWLAAAEHRGRTCFRVFWGRYPDLESARRGRESIPRFFFTATNHPTLVSTRAALLP